MKARELFGALFQTRLIRDRVAVVDGIGEVSDHRFCVRARDARSFEIAHRGAPKVVWNAPWEPRLQACALPSTAKVNDPLSVPMEQPGDDLARSLFDALCPHSLLFENVAQLGCERKVAPLSVLCLAWL